MGLLRLLCEVVITSVFELSAGLMIWLVMESVTPRVVIVASLTVVVYHVLVRVTEHVCAVLALLKRSCLCHADL